MVKIVVVQCLRQAIFIKQFDDAARFGSFGVCAACRLYCRPRGPSTHQPAPTRWRQCLPHVLYRAQPDPGRLPLDVVFLRYVVSLPRRSHYLSAQVEGRAAGVYRTVSGEARWCLG